MPVATRQNCLFVIWFVCFSVVIYIFIYFERASPFQTLSMGSLLTSIWHTILVKTREFCNISLCWRDVFSRTWLIKFVGARLKDKGTWEPNKGTKWWMEWGKDSTGSCFLYGPNKEAANDALLILRPGREAAGRTTLWTRMHTQDACMTTHRWASFSCKVSASGL